MEEAVAMLSSDIKQLYYTMAIGIATNQDGLLRIHVRHASYKHYKVAYYHCIHVTFKGPI